MKKASPKYFICSRNSCENYSDIKNYFVFGFVYFCLHVHVGVWSSIKEGATQLKYWRGPTSAAEKLYEREDRKKPGRQRILSPYFKFIMTLMKIRLNLPLLLLADMFCVSSSRVTEITWTWVTYLHQTLYPALVMWPSQGQVRNRMPLEFRKLFPFTRGVIDCTEFFIDKPGNKEEQYRTYNINRIILTSV